MDGQTVTAGPLSWDRDGRVPHRARETENRVDYRLLFECSNEAMLVVAWGGEALGEILDANPAACKMVQRRREDLTAVGVGEVFDTTEPGLRLALEEQRRVGRFRGTLRLVGRYGNAFFAEVSMAPFGEDKIGVVFRHTAEGARPEEEMRRLNEDLKDQVARSAAQLKATVAEAEDSEALPRESVERLRSVLERTAVGMAQTELDGRLCWVNRGFCEIVGYAEEELLGKTLWRITHPHDLEKDRRRVRQLLSGQRPTYTTERRFLRKGGGVVWSDLTVSVVPGSSDDPEYLVAVVEDISERKRLETRRACREEGRPAPLGVEPCQPLSPRQLEVLGLMALGQTNREIAQGLEISVGTVKVHVEHIIAKLGVSARTQAVVWALRSGIIAFPEQSA